MKQIIQNVKTGDLRAREIPAPVVQPGQVLIANQASLVSAGTEKMVMELSKKSLLGKARERPDQVARILEKVRNEGLISTYNQAMTKLDTPLTMGYSSAGVVLATGDGVQEFKQGDRVASNGPHAEIVCIPRNLCAKVPDSVPMDEASFAVVGSIALQGVRLSEISLGESALVIGLGLVGQITVALLKAAGAHVIGTDLDESKCKLARRMGADLARPNLSQDDITSRIGSRGVDTVIITASTKSNQPITLAAESVRQKGRVVLVGVVGLELDRRPFYFKEAEFVVSCSYGPGRYDDDYERRGIDYPAAYVRWTQQRNIQAVVDLMANNSLDVKPLISHRVQIEEAERAYEIVNTGSESYMGIVLTYPQVDELQQRSNVASLRNSGGSASPKSGGKVRYGLLGAGNFASMVMLPAIEKCREFEPVSIVSANGVSGSNLGERGKFERAATDESDVFQDPGIGAVFSLTRHDLHAQHVCKAIEHQKHIFVEKPLCVNLKELEEIEAALQSSESNPLIMVGFNRRFAPLCRLLHDEFKNTTPLTVSIRFNAGALPQSHWTQNESEGGGRIVGEACHGIDLATYLTGSPPVRVYAEAATSQNGERVTDDQCYITIRHENGSVSNVAYLSGGSKSFPKERIEVFGGGKVGVIDDYKSLILDDGRNPTNKKMPMDKGHQAELAAWGKALRHGGDAPISWSDIRAVTLASILAVRSLREGQPMDL